jgi:hypothetical protein
VIDAPDSAKNSVASASSLLCFKELVTGKGYYPMQEFADCWQDLTYEMESRNTYFLRFDTVVGCDRRMHS